MFFINFYLTPLYKSGLFPVIFFIIGFSSHLLNVIYQYFDFEKVDYKTKGYIEFTDNTLIINYNEKISFDKFTLFDISIENYYDEKINRYSRLPIERRGSGLLNTITLVYENKKMKFNFKLENETHRRVLFYNLFSIVTEHKLKNINTKKAIKLIDSSFHKDEKYEQYIGELLKNRKISCTEGLLMIGYKSYEEAKQLRKKYWE